jgi:YesN/AraC family two-component response regulator
MHIKSMLSDIQYIQLKWLYILTSTGLAIDIIIFLSETIIEYNPRLDPLRIYPYLGLAFLVFLISYFSIWQPEIFKNKMLDKEIKNSDVQDKQKYQRNRLNSQEMELIYSELTQIMEREALYKNTDISLPVLALKLNQPTHTLSQVINTKAIMTFYTFINSYRVNEVKRLLLENTNESLLTIAFKAGFNSKSTFNTFFKKLTGMRPSDFKKQVSS